MSDPTPNPGRYLVIDTCGDVGSLALAEGQSVLCERLLPPRTASAQLVGAIREELQALGWPLRTLSGVAVVNGPGSFTGVRVGLAAAKGLCEVADLRLVTISRLEVLLAAGGAQACDLAVLDAGRGEFYVRAAVSPEEELLGRAELVARSAQRRLLVAEEKLLHSMQELGPLWIDLAASHALPLAIQHLQQGGEDLGTVDANYVRQARGLYAAAPAAPAPSEPA